MSRYLSADEKACTDDYPNLDFDGKRMLKEIEYQIFDNPSWSIGERMWWNTLRNNFLGCVMDYEMKAQEAYMKGVEWANNNLDASA